MIKVFKILHKIYDVEITKGLLQLSNNTTTRGHSLKLSSQPSRIQIRRNSFSVRVVKPWNSLPQEVVMSPSQWRRQDFFSGGTRSLSPFLPFLLPFLPPSLSPPLPFPPSLSSPALSRPSQAGSQDCQNEEADRSSAPPLPCPPLPCPPFTSP